MPLSYSDSSSRMSLRGFDEPNKQPRTCFSNKKRSNSDISTDISVAGATAACTTRPRLPTRLSACAIYGPRPTSVVITQTLAISPRVRSVTSGTASSTDSATWVAPNSRERSRLNSTGSIAMMLRAPAILAPCTALMPTPPTPITATVSPALASPVRTTLPYPVVTPHPSSAALSSGTPSSTLTTEAIGTTVYSEKVPTSSNWLTSRPRAWTRYVPSSCGPENKYAPRSHRLLMPQ